MTVLPWVLLAIAGFWAICGLIVIGCLPHWVANATDGDLAEFGIGEGL